MLNLNFLTENSCTDSKKLKKKIMVLLYFQQSYFLKQQVHIPAQNNSKSKHNLMTLEIGGGICLLQASFMPNFCNDSGKWNMLMNNYIAFHEGNEKLKRHFRNMFEGPEPNITWSWWSYFLLRNITGEFTKDAQPRSTPISIVLPWGTAFAHF